MSADTGPGRVCVVLVGPPGAGKSTIGRKLARELGAELVDTDAVIEAETGRTIPDIFSNDGEPAFRRIEEDVVRRAVVAEAGIVSLGGGAILSAATRELLRERTVVYLEISVAEGLRRTGAATHRPLLAGADPGTKYRELMRTRRPLYREVASVRVRTDGRSPGRVVRNILTRLGMEPLEPNSVAAQDCSPEGTGPGRRSRRRRRGGRGGAKTASAANSATQNETSGTTGDSSTAGQDSADAQSKPRKSRRSRRGGRRRSKGAAAALATAPDSTTSGVEAEPGQSTSTPAGAAGSDQHVTRERADGPGNAQSGSETARSGSAAQSGSSSGSNSGPSDDATHEGTRTRSRSSRRRRRGGSRRISTDPSVAMGEGRAEASATAHRDVGSQRSSGDSTSFSDTGHDKTGARQRVTGSQHLSDNSTSALNTAYDKTGAPRRSTGSRRPPGDSAPPDGAHDNTGAAQQNSRARGPRAARRPAGPPTSITNSTAAAADSQHGAEHGDPSQAGAPGHVDTPGLTASSSAPTAAADGATTTRFTHPSPSADAGAAQRDPADLAHSGRSRRRRARRPQAQQESEQTA